MLTLFKDFNKDYNANSISKQVDITPRGCFLAILRRKGFESRNQECTLAVIESLKEEGEINIDSRFINTLKITKIKETDHSIIQMREDFQYGVELNFKRKDQFDELIKMCKELIDLSREIIHG